MSDQAVNQGEEKVTMTETSADATSDEKTSAAELEKVDAEKAAKSTEIERHNAEQNAVIDRAAHAAIEAGVPGKDEFLTLALTAKMLCLSGAAPKLVRNNPHIAFHIAMVGRDLGISPSMAMNLIDVIDGQNGPQISLSPQLRAAQVKRMGLGVMKPIIQRPERAVWVALHPGGSVDFKCASIWPEHAERCVCNGIIGSSEFTWDDAISARLADHRCQPHQHVNDCKCKYNWKTYGFRMCSWRAAGYCADDFFPEAAVGLYSPDELGAVVDEQGKAIDVESLELPEGYGRKAIETKRADSDALWELQERIAALPNDERVELRAKWQQLDRLAGVGAYRLDEGQLKLATSFVSGLEKKAEKRVQLVVADAREVVRRAVAAKLVDLLCPFSTRDDLSDESVPEQQSLDETPAERDSSAEPSETSESAQSSTADAELSDEAVPDAAGAEATDEEIERVKKMKPGEVRQTLEDMKLDASGTIDVMRHRLTIALLRNRIAAVENAK